MSNNRETNTIIENLYFEMYPKLFIYAKNALNDQHLAEEAVQETFRIACAKSDRLLESQNRPGWLTSTLKYVIYNTRRSQLKLRKLLLTATAMAETPHELSQSDVNMEMYCTSVLGKEDFELLKRIALENKTMLEASDELGISVEACKKRVQRAKIKLKKSISEELL